MILNKGDRVYFLDEIDAKIKNPLINVFVYKLLQGIHGGEPVNKDTKLRAVRIDSNGSHIKYGECYLPLHRIRSTNDMDALKVYLGDNKSILKALDS